MKTNWPTKKLGEVCDFVFGYSFRADDFNESGDGLPVIRIGDIDKGITKKFYNKKYNNKYLVNNSEILIGLSGSIKVNKWKGKKALLNQRIVKVHNFPSGVSENFVYYQLPKVLKRLEIQISQGTVKNVLLPHLFNLKILVSSLSIQQKIVKRLDAIRKAQELNEEQISHTNELFQSLLQKELDPKGKYWKMARLGSILSVLTDYHANGSYKILREHVELKSEPDYAYMVRTSDLEKNNYIDNVKYISKDAYNFLKKTKLYGGEVLINKIGSAGKIYLMPHLNKPVSLGMNLFLLRIKKEVSNNLFIYYFLNTKIGTSQLLSRVTGAVTKTITKDSIRSIRTPLPPLKTQCQIVKKLSAVQEYKKKLLKQKQLLQELFECVLHKSFSGENL